MSTQKSGTSEVDMQIGQAWSLHFKAQHQDAVKSFGEIVRRWPENIDANYGLALSLRGAGQKAEAAKVFATTKSLVETARANQSSDESRLMMISRMIEQQLVLVQS